MDSHSNLLCLDLASYGTALAIINQFCDDDQAKVFEVSPVGTAGILILLIQDQTTAELLKNEIFSYYKASILSSSLIIDLNVSLLKTYLSQNVPVVATNLLIQEFSFVSEGFTAADILFLNKIDLVDFRVIRTYPLNIILVSTSKDLAGLQLANEKIRSRTYAIIPKVEPVLKQYFEITKN